MPKIILGINPGGSYLGYALFQNSELRDWGIKATKKKWTGEKRKKIGRVFKNFLDEFNPDYIALKKLHPARSSPELNTQITKFKELCHTRKIPIYEYPITYLEKILLTERMNKKKLVEEIFKHYPVLFSEFDKQRLVFSENEKKHSNKIGYHETMFEAVALGHVCFNQLDNQ
jgi:Holliday junction resolvasome RuvABC endonuclease subunit